MIAERLVALLKGIISNLGVQDKPVWEHMDMVLDTGEPQQGKVGIEHLIAQEPHVIAYYDGACRQKRATRGYMIYGPEE